MKKILYQNKVGNITVKEFLKEQGINDAYLVTMDGMRLQIDDLIDKEGEICIYNFFDEIGKKAQRVSTSAILALAVKKLYPGSKLAGEGINENGFFYDFDLEGTFKSEDLVKVSKQMKSILRQGINVERINENLIGNLSGESDDYLRDILNQSKDSILYNINGINILLQSPLCVNFSKIKNFKLLNSSTAYWQGNEKNKMLQRIYGVSFDTREQLDEYLELHQKLERRNNKRIGKELELFFFDDTAPGMPYWLPKGLKMFNVLVDFWRKEHEERGYQEFSAPLLNDSELWKISGHWEHYRKDMFVFNGENGDEKALKPMSCPNAIKVYQAKLRSYKDLPLRFNDIDVIHRNEKSGELNGMLRVRMFRQDDSHNFIREDQIASEIKDILEIANKFYSVFGLEYKVSLSTRPESYIGDISIWNHAEEELKSVLDSTFGPGNYNVKYGEGAFYGPKIDIQMQDSLGREWQMGTIQLDFQLPKRFGITYISEDGKKETPIILHRVIYGSLERFIGIITEHFDGAFPLWFSPIQVEIVTFGDEAQLEYGKQIEKYLRTIGVRAEINSKNESIGRKIRYAQTQKIPYVIIIGNSEVTNNNISVRSRKYGDLGNMQLDAFLTKLTKEIDTYSMDN